MGVPSHVFRATLAAAQPHLRAWVPIVSLTKGFEQHTKLRMTQVAAEIATGHPTGVLTGPNLAKEILDGHAAAAVLAIFLIFFRDPPKTTPAAVIAGRKEEAFEAP